MHAAVKQPQSRLWCTFIQRMLYKPFNFTADVFTTEYSFLLQNSIQHHLHKGTNRWMTEETLAAYKKTTLVSYGQIFIIIFFLLSSGWLVSNKTRNLNTLLGDAQFVTQIIYKKNSLLYVQWISKKNKKKVTW